MHSLHPCSWSSFPYLYISNIFLFLLSQHLPQYGRSQASLQLADIPGDDLEFLTPLSSLPKCCSCSHTAPIHTGDVGTEPRASCRQGDTSPAELCPWLPKNFIEYFLSQLHTSLIFFLFAHEAFISYCFLKR